MDNSIRKWRRKYKEWKEVPKDVQQGIITTILEPPAAVLQHVLPPNDGSVSALLDHELPAILSRKVCQADDTMPFLHEPEPNFDETDPDFLSRVMRHPVPPPVFIRSLAKPAKQYWLDGVSSITYEHLPLKGGGFLYPMWIITLWNRILMAHESKEQWATAQSWLDKLMKGKKKVVAEDVRERVENVKELFACLPWNQKKQGLSNGDPIHTLTRYLGPTYTSDSNQADMLELLRLRISTKLDLSRRFTVEDVFMTSKLQEAYTRRQSDVYNIDQGYEWLRNLAAESVKHRKTIITNAHLKGIAVSALGEAENHWIAVALDFKAQVIWIGEPLGGGAPAGLLSLYQWWVSNHTASKWVEKPLPITVQIDGHSCGPLTSNCLEHFVFPEVPLVSTKNVHVYRMDIFCRLAKRVLECLEDDGEDSSQTDGSSQSDSEFDSSDESDDESSSEGDSDYGYGTDGENASDGGLEKSTDDDCSSVNGVGDGTGNSAEDVSGAKSETEDMPVSTDSPISLGVEKPNANPLPEKKSPKASLITRFFMTATPEEKAAQDKRDWDQLANTYDQHQVNEAKQKAKAATKKRLDARERKQEQRARDKIRREALKQKMGLVLRDEQSTRLNVAEVSRPRRALKKDIRAKKKKPQGRKPLKEDGETDLTNWQQPILWSGIVLAAKRTGKPWSPRAIVQELHRVNFELYGRLREQVVGRWIDREAKARGESKWRDEILERVKNGNSPGGQTTRTGILEPYPELRRSINERLESLRFAGVPLTSLSIRAIMVAMISKQAPEIFETVLSDGSRFKCSESFVKDYLHKLNWSKRKATRAAQKLPEDHAEQIYASFLFEALTVRDHGTPAALRVNTDQAQSVYLEGTDHIWNKSGERQVSTIGQEEKRAFTVIPSIAADGTLLPWQAVYHGQTKLSCPDPKTSRGWEELNKLGFRLLPSKSHTYWSTQETMRDLVDNIIAPYFRDVRKKLGLSPDHRAIWRIDCWSVHRSEEFLGWMKTAHHDITIIFVPGGCTGLFQPLDVGIQRVMKLAMRRSSHRDIVGELMEKLEQHAEKQLSEAEAVADFKLDVRLKTVRDRSAGWMLYSYREINDQELIMKAFELCRVPDQPFNLSHASITSPEALAALRDLPTQNLNLYKKIIGLGTAEPADNGVKEAAFEDLDAVVDESDVVTTDLIQFLKKGEQGLRKGLAVNDDGNLVRSTQADEPNVDIGGLDIGERNGEKKVLKETRLGRRVVAPKRFGGSELWDANDDDDEDPLPQPKKNARKQKRKVSSSEDKGKKSKKSRKGRKSSAE
ncbi:hypothetical protein VNI00_016160 [Paramarasmius palmivorus]|uniref:Ubiquitin-like protease family profile domain-containing protein n=1 Tax=Paramarasmius palmivorus TaxID=297713 RepID=A0AAW0BEF1_9AGAR